ncbi:MAG TPA: ABC transporter ATP-binding protein [Candidatus Eisenbacteria bacterium]|nr:ABC transporter ATP-binding protein [Candidatus Eisenbacteria bacterium]
MKRIAIRAENIGKVYTIAARREKYDTLRDSLTRLALAPFRRLAFALGAHSDSGMRPKKWDRYVALDDVSFEVGQGEVVGIIGRNGAGKSTLLKILSRITEPTSGVADLYGRVGSLLEVGTGFHSELTGRENVYLNGAILGMKKAEIDRKFDEIVSFAEVERFIDTPVKRYSTGMQLRLAFAVAAHLEPEILLVDEVLAVGDARFQKKCLSKMQDVGQQGRTVLFVSHDMASVTRLCPRCLLLEDGRLLKDGPSHQVVSAYLHSGLGTTAAREWPVADKAPSGKVARLRAVRVRSDSGEVSEAVDIRREIAIEMSYDVLVSGHMLLPYFNFYNEEGLLIFSSNDIDPAWRQRPRPAGRYTSTAWIPGNLLSEGTVLVDVGLETSHENQFYETDAVAFHVIDTLDGDSARGDYTGPMSGVVRPKLRWTTEYHDEAAHRRAHGRLSAVSR